MPHIHTNPGDHDPTVSAFIFRQDEDGNWLAYVHKHRKLGMYMQFGGHIEIEEHPWQSMAHELSEETGYTLSELKVLQPTARVPELDHQVYLHPLPFVTNTHPFPEIKHWHSDMAFALVATDEPKGSPDEGESDDIQWLSKNEVAALDTDTMFANVQTVFMHGFKMLESIPEGWELVAADSFHH